MSGFKDVVKDNKKILLLLGGLLLVVVVGFAFMNSDTFLSDSNNLTNLTDMKYSKPEQVMKSGVDYQAVLKTSVGDITVDLFENETPVTVNSFLFLVSKHYYENMIFHRVIKDFVIQTGDPTAKGTGGPGYTINDEITDRKYEGYVLGMANAGANTNGSQFFITSGNMSSSQAGYLDGKYTIFGKVIKGFSVVDSIEKVETDKSDKPLNDVKLSSVQIVEN